MVESYIRQNKTRRLNRRRKKYLVPRPSGRAFAALCVAGVAVVWVQRITGRTTAWPCRSSCWLCLSPPCTPTVILGACLASLASVLAVNFAFSPLFCLHFTSLPENLFSGFRDAGRIHHETST